MNERSLIAAKLRSLADQFKTFATKELSGLAFPHLDTQSEAGKLIIRAYGQGYLPDLPGLAEMIRRTKEPDKDGCRLTPDDLFRVFCGTHHALAVDPRHGVHIQRDAKIDRGILPSTFSDVLKGAPVNSVTAREHHHAMVCNWLADTVTAPDNKTDGTRNVVPSNRDDVLPYDPAILERAQAIIEFERLTPAQRAAKAKLLAQFENCEEAIGMKAPLSPPPANKEKYLLISEICRMFKMGDKAARGFCDRHKIPIHKEARRFKIALVPFATAYAQDTNVRTDDAVRHRVASTMQQQEIASKLNATTAQFFGL